MLDRLYEDGIDSRTLVAFVSDNGPDGGGRAQPGWKREWPDIMLMGSAGPLSGNKNQLAEGGIRALHHAVAGHDPSRPGPALSPLVNSIEVALPTTQLRPAERASVFDSLRCTQSR